MAWLEGFAQGETPQMPPQAVYVLVPRTVRYQRTVLTLHQEQKHPSALQGKDCQLRLALEGFDGPSLGEHKCGTAWVSLSPAVLLRNREAAKTKTFEDT